MRRLILHAGIGKTATSTIQSDLVNNTHALAEQGVALPSVDRAHRPFNGNLSTWSTTLFSDRALFLEENIADGYDSPDKLADRRRDYTEQFDRHLDSSEHTTFLVSCEAITNYDPVTFGRLMDFLDERFDRIDAIVCLRHPAELLASDIQQRVKVGFVIEQVLAGRAIINYENLLGNLLGRCASVSCYDFADAIEHGVTQRFLDECGLSPTGFDFGDERENESLSQLATELMSALNAERPLKVEGAWGEGRFLEDRFFYFAIPGPSFRVPSDELARLGPRIDEQLDWVEASFGLRLRRASDGDLGRPKRLEADEAAHLAVATSDLLNEQRSLRESLDAAKARIAELEARIETADSLPDTADVGARRAVVDASPSARERITPVLDRLSNLSKRRR